MPITVSAINGTVTIAMIRDTPSNNCVRFAVRKAQERKRKGARRGCQVLRSTHARATASISARPIMMKGAGDESVNNPWRDKANDRVTRTAASRAPPR